MFYEKNLYQKGMTYMGGRIFLSVEHTNLTIHSRPETMKQIGIMRSNWLICKIFPPEKSSVTVVLEALKQKIHIQRTKPRCQIDQEK